MTDKMHDNGPVFVVYLIDNSIRAVTKFKEAGKFAFERKYLG
jgi:hypothetical protein